MGIYSLCCYLDLNYITLAKQSFGLTTLLVRAITSKYIVLKKERLPLRDEGWPKLFHPINKNILHVFLHSAMRASPCMRRRS